MDPQKLLATLLHLSEEQQRRIAELLTQLERQTQHLTHASQQADRAASAIEHSGQTTALHLQAAAQEGVETALRDTLATVAQRAERAFKDAGQPLLHTLAGVTKAAEETETRLRRAVGRFRWQWAALAGGTALAAVLTLIAGAWLTATVLVSQQRAELERLDTEIAQSEARLKELSRRGGKIELTDCGGRLCVYASTHQGENYKNWTAPWTGRDGLPLVILRGY